MSRFYSYGFHTARRPGFRQLVACLITCATSAIALAQSVPDQFLGELVLDEPLPTQFVSGQTYWVTGSLANPGIPAMTFAFLSERGVLEHRILVANGRFEHPLVFKHTDAGLHDFRIIFFPSGQQPFNTEVYSGIEIVEGSGEIDTPWPYYDGFVDKAYFRPNAMTVDALEYPPLFVRMGGRVESVLVLVSDGHGGNLERELSDDGMNGDLKAGDGIFTMAGEPYNAPDVDIGPFGSIPVIVVFQDAASQFQHLPDVLVAPRLAAGRFVPVEVLDERIGALLEQEVNHFQWLTVGSFMEGGAAVIPLSPGRE